MQEFSNNIQYLRLTTFVFISDKSDTKTSSVLQSKLNSSTSNGPKQYDMNGHASQPRENPTLQHAETGNTVETER